MLKLLSIQDFILIDHCRIEFSNEFNAITGETGSGKSALLIAISLINGNKATSDLVRQGKDKAVIEAVFENISKETEEMLLDAGIQIEEDLLIIRREIYLNGKNRNFINHQPAQAFLLKKISQTLIQIVSQDDNRCLKDIETHVSFLDLFGGLETELEECKAAYKEWADAKIALFNFQKQINEKKLRVESLQAIFEEISEINPTVNEDETLFNEYQIMANSSDLLEGIENTVSLIDGEESALFFLRQANKRLMALSRLDASLLPLEESLNQTMVSLKEISHSLERHLSRVECNPYKMEEASNRLEKLSRLKKKYGSTLQEVISLKEKSEKELLELEQSDDSIEELKKRLDVLEKNRNQKADFLSSLRKQFGTRLEAAIKDELHALNMSACEFKVDISEKEHSSQGKDFIEFFLAPNPGEPFISLTESASGGEVSRILIALLVLTTKKNAKSAILFDEIDANIGGTSAKKVGLKLKEIGTLSQVIAITHFPQVAKEASFHVKIHKETINGRTLTIATALNDESRKEELRRMVGDEVSVC